MVQKVLHFFLGRYVHLSDTYPSTMRIVRFVISGGTATTVNLGTLFTLTHFMGIWYIYSSLVAFSISFLISFTLQKFWTFGNGENDRIHVQATIFLSIILFALGLNTILIYLFVEFVHTHYIFGQLVSGVIIAVVNYFSYKHLVFGDPNNSTRIL